MVKLLLRHGIVAGLLVACVAASGCGRIPKPADGGGSNPGANIKQTTSTADNEDTSDKPMTTPQSEPYGTTAAGEEVAHYGLSNRSGMKVSIIDLGGIITSVEVPDRNGKLANVTLNFPNLEAYEANAPYFGGICGRYANRIAGGKFSLDGNEYSLFLNNGPNSLHGGQKGFMKQVWKSESFHDDKSSGVKMTYTSPDGEEGYPGALKTTVTYTLTDANELRIDYQATTDKPTVLNLTNHAYWNLTGIPGSLITDHELTLHCSKYLPVDETGIPSGELAPVEGTCMDFRTPEKIGARITEPVNGAGGYDHCYVVDGKNGELRPAARIVDRKSGRVMEIFTTEPGIQFYTGNYLEGNAKTGNAPKHGAFCLETQRFPDSPNHPDFPTSRLDPGQVYTHTTVHKFSVEK